MREGLGVRGSVSGGPRVTSNAVLLTGGVPERPVELFLRKPD